MSSQGETMRGRLRMLSARFVLVTMALPLAATANMLSRASAEEVPGPREHEAVFGEAKVWSLHIGLSAEEFDAMQPAVAAFGAPPAPASSNAGNGRTSERNLFGTEFPWVQADVTIDGKTLKKAGVRYSGDITYFVSARGLKRPLKIAFDKFEKQPFHGLSALALHAMPLDPSKARETLAYAIFRSAGAVAPRTAYAEVSLTVPGKYDHETLGLYTVVEDLDGSFLADHFTPGTGLLMRPFRVRGVEFLGDDWQRYEGLYRPQRPVSKDEAKRVIEFARLVNQADDDEFEKRIDSFLDVDAFLRFMAANALTSNLESFFALGHNYGLYLDSPAGRFHFLPGDLEFSLANFLLMGSPQQLADLSLLKPYPGENKLPDRLLAIKKVKEQYLALVERLSSTALASAPLLEQIERIENTTQAIRAKEAQAVASRNEPAAGLGGPGPQAPDLRSFLQQRSASIAAQLAGSSKGFVPQPLALGPPAGGGFGPPGRTAGSQPIDDKTFHDSVQVPPEFEATLFAAPPRVNYPVAIAAEPSGVIYVAVDEQGSLGRTPGGGKILRCVDLDDDGMADTVTIFAKADHPRGLIYRDGAVWVMHPPTLSVFHDDDGDGVSDRQQVLVTGLTTDQIANRGGDHTTNCVRMGIDGWLYIGVGDYGIKQAVGTDGTAITQRGGGIVRVRPDGTEMEVYCSGLRNPFDLAIDPFMNIFARDNTNDGGGWDTRVSLLRQSALYGYTQLYANFTDEIMPTLGTFGGGGGTGALFVQDPSWPPQYGNTLFTGDWGRSQVYRHELTPHGATFDLKQEIFLTMPRATGMDIDARGRLFVASWLGGEAAVFVGPNVGFVARITPKGLSEAEPLPDLKHAGIDDLMAYLAAPRSVMRLHAQGEILRRGRSAAATQALDRLASDTAAPLAGRVAAVFTLKQLDGSDSHASLLKLAKDAALGEFAMRALTDRRQQLDGLSAEPFVAALSDESPRVRAQALISLGRLNDPTAAKSMIPLTSRPQGSVMPSARPIQNQPDADRVVPHLAVRALVSLRAADACLETLDGPHWQGALWAMRYLHDGNAVDKLIKKLAVARDAELRRGILATLIRLYHREADYQGSWWGIRPDNTGPYYEPVEWESSKRIGAILTAAVSDGDPETVAFLKAELARHQVSLAGLPLASGTSAPENQQPIVLPKADANDPNQIGNMTYEVARSQVLIATGDPAKGELLFKSQSCVACHTTADGQRPKGPHLVDIGKRYKPEELVESILQPSAKIAQGYETYHFSTIDGLVYTGFVVSESAAAVRIRETSGVERALNRAEIEDRAQQKLSAMPDGLIANLTVGQCADLLAYLQSLK